MKLRFWLPLFVALIVFAAHAHAFQIALVVAAAALTASSAAWVAALAIATAAAVGSYLDQRFLFRTSGPDIQGPRLSDLNAPWSSYNQAIPYVAGTVKVRGQMIWARPITESVTTTSTGDGGKGGGGGGGSVTSYSYSRSFAVALCEGPIAAVGRVWANGKLIFDGRADRNGPLAGMVLSPQQMQAYMGRWEFQFSAINAEVHLGTTAQTPSPIIEAFEGAGNVPAYRGTAYLVFREMPLADYGNGTPIIEAEVIGQADPVAMVLPSEPGAARPPSTAYPAWPQRDAWRTGARSAFAWNFTALYPVVIGGIQKTVVFKFDRLAREVVATLVLQEQPAFRAWCEGAGEDPDQFRATSQGFDVDDETGEIWCWGGFPRVGTIGVDDRAGWLLLIDPDTWAVRLATQVEDSERSLRLPGYNLSLHGVGRVFAYKVGANGDLGANRIVVGNGLDLAVIERRGAAFQVLAAGGADARLTGQDLLSNSFVWPDVWPNNEVHYGQPVGFAFNPASSTAFVRLGGMIVAINAAGAFGWTLMAGRPGTAFGVPPTPAYAAFSGMTFDTVSEMLIYPMANGLHLVHPVTLTVTASLAPPAGVLYFEGSALDAGTNVVIQGVPTGIPADDLAVSNLINQPTVAGYVVLASLRSGQQINTSDAFIISTDPLEIVLHVPSTELRDEFEQGGYAYLGVFYDSLNSGLWGQFTTSIFSTPGYLFRIGGLLPTRPSLGQIIRELSVKAGLTLAEVDATSLDTTSVRGFRFDRAQGSAADAIATLRVPFFFDFRTRDGVLEFLPRTSTVSRTIPDDDLGVRGAQDDRAPKFAQAIDPEIGLPRDLIFSGLDPELYDPLPQRAQVLASTTRATGERTVAAPVVMTADEAALTARKILEEIWAAAQGAFEIATRPRHLAIDAGDVIEVGIVTEAGSRSARLRADSTDFGVDGRVVIRGAVADPDGVTAIVTGTPGPAAQQGIVVRGPVDPVLLNLPCLDARFANEAGAAAAVQPAFPGANFSGALLYRALDGSAFDPYRTFDRSTPKLVTASALPAWDPSRNVWHESGAIDVRIAAGSWTFESRSELDVYAGKNLILIGGEIVAFQTAQLLAPGLWRLSRLLRGRFGTERLAVAQVAGTRAFVLDVSAYRIISDLSERGRSLWYRAVEAGGDPSSAPTVRFTNESSFLKPFAPVHVAGTRDAGDLTITWTRRTRFGGELQDGGDVPLNEAREAYEVDILDGLGAVKRTLSATTPSVTYTAAQQSADFGSPQASVAIVVFQISDTAGRGFPALAEV